MIPAEHRLLRHLGWVVLVKLLVLAGLWQAFVAHQHVKVDEQSTAMHLGVTPEPARAASAPPVTQLGEHP